ncbi:hypothetical protein [Sorlinia euscelidii]|uniref:hypothetical protein n=1 Tax=Sorlinia euscelidii TaxID=3081148 RepID=UPI00374DFEC8
MRIDTVRNNPVAIFLRPFLRRILLNIVCFRRETNDKRRARRPGCEIQARISGFLTRESFVNMADQ